MPENAEIDYGSLTTPQLAKKTVETHGNLARKELPLSIKSAVRKLDFEIRNVVDPAGSQQHELHQYFGPEISPDPDDRESFNDPHSFRRHEIFEREGNFITSLRRKGGETIGEIQTEMRNWTNSIYWRTDEYGIGKLHNGINKFLVRTYELTLPDSEGKSREKAIKELSVYAEEVAYHNLIVNFLTNDSRLIEKFIQRPDFHELRKQFIDAHIGASKADDSVIANAILSGHFLMHFEGKDPAGSPSQKFIKNGSEYHQKIAEFIESAGTEGQPPSLTQNRRENLANLEKATLNAIDNRYFPNGIPEIPEESDEVVKGHLLATETLCRIVSHPDVEPETKPGMSRWAEEQQILRALNEQFERHNVDLEWLRRIKNRFPRLLIIDPDGRRNLIQTVIGNTLMGKARTFGGEVYTSSRYMPHSEGYFGADNSDPIPDIIPSTEIPTTTDIVELIKDIYDGQPEAGPGKEYQSQTQKIYEAAPVILRYLTKSENVPDEVRQLMEIVTDKEELARKITARYGAEHDQDINYVNIFFREGGLSEAQKFITYRLITEFIEGVNTNIILTKDNPVRKRGRVWGGTWVNDDFSKLDNSVVETAISRTLEDGKNQLLLYDHKLDKKGKKRVEKLTANRRMSGEKYLWDSYDTRFKRWVNKRGSYDNALEVAIECVCPLRDTIFNPRTFQQW